MTPEMIILRFKHPERYKDEVIIKSVMIFACSWCYSMFDSNLKRINYEETCLSATAGAALLSTYVSIN